MYGVPFTLYLLNKCPWNKQIPDKYIEECIWYAEMEVALLRMIIFLDENVSAS